MSVDTRLILANKDEISRACRGWRQALPQPVVQDLPSPFTGRVESVTSWDPTPLAPFPADAVLEPDVTELATSFEVALDTAHLERLASLLDAGDDALAPALIPPPEARAVEVRVMSSALVERLARAGADAATTADAWASAVSADREWCARVLTDLVELSARAIAEGKQVYVLLEES